MTVRVRFAPSPTGYLHIGGARTALFNWMFARRHGGRFLLRIEDTDLKRTIPGAIENLMAALRWLGLDWDEGPDVGGPYGPYVQTERAPLYRQWARWLVEHDKAYQCFCTPAELEARRATQQAAGDLPGYDRRCRALTPEQVAEKEAAGLEYVIRFKMPIEGVTVVPDAIRGDITFDNSQITDFVLLKSNGLPTYHLAHVVDDHFMAITHIMRADEWINTAPLHVQIWQAFGWPMPVYAHLSLVLNPSGKGKLSKRTQAFREDGQEVLVQVEEFRQAGYLPQAVVNFLANVGWAFGEDREKFPIEEAIPRFELKSINPAPARLPYAKLDWLNGQYIQAMTPLELARAVKPFLDAAGYEVNPEALLTVIPSLSVRLKRLNEAVEFLRFLFDDRPLALTAADLTDKKLGADGGLAAYRQARDLVAAVEPYNLEQIEAGLRQLGERVSSNGKAGPFLGKLRLAITGQPVSPPLFESMLALGRQRVLGRLDEVIALMGKTP
ncbi:MAG: glutamate--tRNA ligase [Chloroflexota bacterium]